MADIFLRLLRILGNKNNNMGIGFNQLNTAYDLSLRTSDRCHWCGNPYSQRPPAGGLPRHQCAHWFLAMTGES